VPHISGDRLQIRSIPWTLWAVCGLFVVIGILMGSSGQPAGLLFVASSLLVIALLTKVTSLTAERGRGTVTLTSWTLMRGTQRREIPSRDIAQISIEQSAGSEEQTFRMALVLASGEQVPLTNFYSGGRDDKQAAAQRLSDFLAPDRGDALPVVTDASTCHEQTGQTAGVDWRLETWVDAEGNACTRWVTAAGAYANGLLIVAQMDSGLGRLPWSTGPLAGVSKIGFKSSLLEYHFKPADVEAVDAVNPVDDLDLRLHGCYLAFATFADTARQWLGPARVEALADWAAAHPAPVVQSADSDVLGGMLLLAGPSGLWLVFRDATSDPACIAAIASLGAALAAVATA
jgi:hypothetical protein